MIDLGLLSVAGPVDAAGTMHLVFQCSCEMAHRDGLLRGWIGQGWCGCVGWNVFRRTTRVWADGTEKRWTEAMEQYHQSGKPRPGVPSPEQVLLGAMLADNTWITPVLETGLSSEDFALLRHRYLFVAIRTLHERDEPVDLITLSEALKESGLLEEIGGTRYLTGLALLAPSDADTADIVVEARKLHRGAEPI